MQYVRPKDADISKLATEANKKMNEEITKCFEIAKGEKTVIENSIILKDVLMEHMKNKQLEPFFTKLKEIANQKGFWDQGFYSDIVKAKDVPAADASKSPAVDPKVKAKSK